jgi:hypothetical protein
MVPQASSLQTKNVPARLEEKAPIQVQNALHNVHVQQVEQTDEHASTVAEKVPTILAATTTAASPVPETPGRAVR